MAEKPSNIYEKILSSHVLEGALIPGEEIGIKIDQTLTQDATGTMTYLQFEALNVSRVSTELSVSYVDHNTLQQGFENADDHKYLETVASRYGILFSKPGNGICHQVHLEKFAIPGKTLLGSDSHTPTAGALGTLALGAGGLDVALAMAGKPFYLTAPRVIKIELTGYLKASVTAKDIILHLLGVLTTKGNVGFAIEYGGDALERLTVPMRATIANMGAETGVTTSIFPSDEIARDFLKKQAREEDWIEVKADHGAEYEKVIGINLDELEPLVAKPHSPDNIDTVKNIRGLQVDQVCIGSCTNSSYEDLMMAAEILKDNKVHPRVSLIVAPGSRQVLEMISENGALSELIKSGARIAESACGFCIGATHAPSSNGVSLRTNNRNFLGRSGTADAEVYLVSPIVAAVSALRGEIASPADLTLPTITPPESYYIDDSMILEPRYEGKPIKGPNIRELPRMEQLPGAVRGVVAIKVGDKVTTDHIMPAGSKLKFRSNIEKYASFVFAGLDESFVQRAIDTREKKLANIIIAGESYGQGSSREHAALCPAYLGVKVVVAKSIERIHRQNLINVGIVPLLFEHEGDYDRIEEGDSIEIPEVRSRLAQRSDIVAINSTKHTRISLKHDLSEKEIRILLKGGKLNYYAG
ncbi:MAG: aconitate hydratase [Deltaproteobacteria bacterium]|nr:aconitate hydratase [Deltaproteobacteria bacterium]MBW2076926.1 aconitate hydratase [Deltaproteobacteria bacterium]